MIRRDFIKNAGCLTIGFTIGRPAINNFVATGGILADELPDSLQRTPAINAWLKITADGRLQVLTGKMELGQGIRTAMAQVAAEELNMRMDQVDVTLAATGVTPDEGYTAGSGSMDNSAMSVRYAAAAAREKLMAMAEIALGAPAGKLVISEGIISVKGISKGEVSSQQKGSSRQSSTTKPTRLTFAELLGGKEITDKVTLPVKLKPKTEYKLVGKAIAREDIRLMAMGKAVYLQDLRFDGMLHARILRPPSYQAELISFDIDALRKQFPNMVRTVIDGSFVGIITTNEYTAVQIQAVGQNFCKWKNAPLIEGPEVPIRELLKSLPGKKQKIKSVGNPGFENDRSTVHSASYFKPYMMHGSIGPSCSIALYEKEHLRIWSHSQGVYPLKDTISALLKIPATNIEIIGVPGSGCYGHNGADDVSAEAAILAIANPGKHIRLQWSREDEHLWEPYGSAMIMEVKARMNKDGRITDWQYEHWSDTHGTRPGGNPENLLPASQIRNGVKKKAGGYSGGAYRNSEPYYDIPNQQIDINFFDGPLRVSALRSLGAYANVFAIECFMDELSEKAGIDPFEFRLMHLKDERAKAVLVKLRDITSGAMSKINNAGKNKIGFGIAYSRYKNSAAHCAVAAMVSYDDEKKEVNVHKMVSVIDAGETINLDGVINQTEGGMIQAASWTLQEEVKFNNQKILSTDWKSYPIFRFSQVPETEVVVLVNAEEGPMGAGEAAQGPAGAAIANAVYKATGIRHRDLPIIPIPLPKD